MSEASAQTRRAGALQPPLWRQFRQAAVAVERRILEGGRSASDVSPAVEDLMYAGLRSWGLTQVRLARMVERPPEPVLQALLAVVWGALERHYREPATLVDQAVRAARALGGEPTARFFNGLLRRTLREPERAQDDLRSWVARLNAPDWWVDRLLGQLDQASLEQIAHAHHSPPPFCLRYLDGREPSTVFTRPMARLTDHPQWQQGRMRVQDASAQALASLLPLQPGQQVLDACAAPGGKSILLAQQAPVEVWSVDLAEGRLDRLVQDLQRVGSWLQGQIHPVAADLLQPQTDWVCRLTGQRAPEVFDHLVLDAPCSASGVARRHPDGPWRRSPEQFAQVLALQARLLDVLWPRLRPGGQLVYITCSVFREEGQDQVEAFLRRQPQARSLAAPGLMLPFAQQREDGVWTGRDGFFYARFEKRADG
ncbi:MAG: rRNA ((967)-C(5))-methyltransferase [Pseudomonadota bacterium]